MREAFCILLTIYLLILLIRVIFSWVQAFGRMPYSGPARSLFTIIYRLTEPVLRIFRGLIPPVRMGGMGIDLSTIIVFIGLGILRTIACGG